MSESDVDFENMKYADTKSQCKSKVLCDSWLHDAFLSAENESDVNMEHLNDSDEHVNFVVQKDFDSDQISESSETDYLDTYSVISNCTLYKNFEYLLDLANDHDLPAKDVDFVEDNARKLSHKKTFDDMQHLYGLANQSLWTKNYADLFRYCNKLIKEFPYFPGAYEILGQYYEQIGNRKTALQLFLCAVRLEPKSVNKWLNCIEIAKDLHGIENAIGIAKEAWNRTNDNEIRKIHMDLLMKIGKKEEYLRRGLKMMKSELAKSDSITKEKMIKDLFRFSEEFLSMKQVKRSCESLELVNAYCPGRLSDYQLIALVNDMVQEKMYLSIIGVSKNIKGVDIKLTNFTETSGGLLQFSKELPVEYRIDIIYAVLISILNTEMKNFFGDDSFHRYMKEISVDSEKLMACVEKMFDLGLYTYVIQYMKDFEDKLKSRTYIGRSQENLGLYKAAIETYDEILDKITSKDAFIWELKANLLYKMGRERDAIDVYVKGQNVLQENFITNLSNNSMHKKPSPTKGSEFLLYKLCIILLNEDRMDEYVYVCWRYVFLDSFQFFNLFQIRLCCEDIDFVRSHSVSVQNNLELCFNSGLSRVTEGEGRYISCHHRGSNECQVWSTVNDLLKILSKSYETNLDLIEILAQWGLILQKLLLWDSGRQRCLNVIYVTSGIQNRMRNIHLRYQKSTEMISRQLQGLRDMYKESNQFWNLYHLHATLKNQVHGNLILFTKEQVHNKYPLELIASGKEVSSSVYMGMATTRPLLSEHPENAQLYLNMAVILSNAAISRMCNDRAVPMAMAISFLNDYKKTRGDCQETFFNMGRFFHRINMENHAIYYYEQCLAQEPIGSNDEEKSMLDLSKEAAYNLVYIYKRKKAYTLVEYFTDKYLSI